MSRTNPLNLIVTVIFSALNVIFVTLCTIPLENKKLDERHWMEKKVGMSLSLFLHSFVAVFVYIVCSLQIDLYPEFFLTILLTSY